MIQVNPDRLKDEYLNWAPTTKHVKCEIGMLFRRVILFRYETLLIYAHGKLSSYTHTSIPVLKREGSHHSSICWDHFCCTLAWAQKIPKILL